jgi:uncharacterized protein YgbK (DUF1537 family)
MLTRKLKKSVPSALAFCLTGALLVVVATVVTPALGGRTASPSPQNAPILEKAHRVTSAPSAGSGTVTLWQAPTQAGGVCTVIDVAADSTADSTATGNGGSVCSVGARRPQQTPIVVTVEWLPTAGGVTFVATGHSAANVATLTIVSNGVSSDAPLTGGYFLTTWSVSSVGALPEGGAPRLVASNAAGDVIGALDLGQVINRGR